METSFYTGIGHFCRFIIIAIFAVVSINATLTDDTITIKKASFPTTNLRLQGGSTSTNKILLTWAADPSGKLNYHIEKSRDGERFTPADGRIMTIGSGETTWIEKSPRTINCYRLRMKDEEGHESYSKAIVVHCYKTGEVTLVTATPDDQLASIRVNLDMRDNAFVTMNLIDRQNSIILQQKANGKEGANEFTLKGSDKIPSGVYYLHVVVNGTEKLKVRMIKS